MTTNDETPNPPDKSGENPGPGGAAANGQDPSAAVAAERDQYRDQLLRTAADFDNYRKRTRRELEDAKARGKDDAIKELLAVFDGFELAKQAANSAQTVASVVEGVEAVLSLFNDAADRLHLSRVKTVGERFDPAIHDAIQQQETDAHPPGTILTEVRSGYMVDSRLLRAAMVVVARKPGGKTAEPETPAGTDTVGTTPAGGLDN